MLVDPQKVGSAVIGHINIQPLIAVEIRCNDAECTTDCADSGLPRHILETAVAQIPKQFIDSASVGFGATIFPRGSLGKAGDSIFPVKFDIGRHIQILPAVLVVIKKNGAGTPARIIDASRRSDVTEAAIAVVEQQLVVIQIHHVEIWKTVIVDIAGCHTHAISSAKLARFLRHIGETNQRLSIIAGPGVVSVQAVAQGQRVPGWKQCVINLFAGTQRGALDDIDVQVAIAVVIEKGAAGTDDLRKVDFARHAVEMKKVYAAFAGDIDKYFLRIRRSGEQQAHNACICRSTQLWQVYGDHRLARIL